MQEAEWIRQGGEEATHEEEEEESIPDDFYCPLCDKSFKSQKALANHERSVVMLDGQNPLFYLTASRMHPTITMYMTTFNLLANMKLHIGRIFHDVMLVCLIINTLCLINLVLLGFKGPKCPIEGQYLQNNSNGKRNTNNDSNKIHE